MPVNVIWHNPEKTIVKMVYASPWTWEEFLEGTQQAKDLARTVSHPIGIASHPVGRPPKGNPAHYFDQSIRDMPANAKLLVIVSENYFAATLVRMAVAMHPQNRGFTFIATSDNAAYELIAKRLAKLETSGALSKPGS